MVDKNLWSVTKSICLICGVRSWLIIGVHFSVPCIVKVMLSGSQQFSDSVCVVMLLQMEESLKGSSGETFII